MHLAKDLWATYHRKLYVDWDYETFDDYLKKEVGISKDYASRMRRIFSVFVLGCGVRPSTLDDIGRSKAQLLLPVVNKLNAASWIKKAKDLPIGDLRAEIHKLKVVAAKSKTIEPSDPETPFPDGSKPISLATKVDGSLPNSKQQEFIPRTFRLPEDSDTLLDEALGEAQRITKSASPGFNLTCIAQEFLASRMTKEGKKDGRLHWYMRQMERIYGGRLIHIKKDVGWDLIRDLIENNPNIFGASATEEFNERDCDGGKEPEAA